jgi:C4-dicarboxylate-specific signal transduction histidine kinase
LIKSRINCLEKVNQLLEEYADEPFFAKHPKGSHLPPYLKNLSVKLENERQGMLSEISGVLKNLELMGDIIQTQQSQEIGSEPLVRFQLNHVVDNALRVSLGGKHAEDLEIVNRVSSEICLKSHKSMITHVLVNVIKNAIEAMSHNSESRILTLTTEQDESNRLVLTVTDTGSGIAGGDINRLFEHGYTTKAKGHGFGLHYSALAMHEIGGHITMESPGPGLGATVILTFPPFAG